MFVDIALKAVLIQVVYAAIILAIDKLASKKKK